MPCPPFAARLSWERQSPDWRFSRHLTSIAGRTARSEWLCHESWIAGEHGQLEDARARVVAHWDWAPAGKNIWRYWRCWCARFCALGLARTTASAHFAALYKAASFPRLARLNTRPLPLALHLWFLRLRMFLRGLGLLWRTSLRLRKNILWSL